MLRRLWRVSPVPFLVAFAACSSHDSDQPQPQDAGADTANDICQTPSDEVKKIRASAQTLVIAPGESRDLRVYIEPDVCDSTPIPLTVDNASVAKVDGTFTADRTTSEATVKVTGVAPGTAKISAAFGPSQVSVTVEVRAKDMPACGDPASGNVAPGGTVKGAWGGSLSLASGAALDTTSIDPLEAPSAVAPFDASVSCDAAAKVPDGFTALGPAVTFGPSDKKFLRELQFTVPVNPARMPTTSTLRHVRLQYWSAALKTPRFVPITNPRFDKQDGNWVLRFDAPRLGTYQVLVPNNAGTVHKKRRLTHRAVFGFSMGGIGSSMFGMNHHDKFDVVVPLGGPMDAGFFLNYALQYHFGGFCARKAGDPLTPCTESVGPPTEMYEHVQWFEDWWHQNGIDGTGGTFGRDSMVSIFRDVASAWGDPAFNNADQPHVATGITTPWPLIEGGAADYCTDKTKSTIADGVSKKYYDAKYNPDGTVPIIKFCDGAAQAGQPGKWAPGGTLPLEMVLAVDLNKNGTRDQGEPILVQPHEPFSDLGADGKADKDEPGYDAATNPDPSGDDYDPQYNPLGTEGNHLWDTGEPFEDVGVDGIKCPDATCPFDYGEGNGKFDVSVGLKTFFERDARLQIEKHPLSKDPVGGPWTDDALDQLDFYSDGGIRDIFNWGTVGYHYFGMFPAKNRPAVYYDNWEHLPNAEISSCPTSAEKSDCFDPKDVDWKSLPKSVYLRYGDLDAPQRVIEKGDGQHVGYTDQVFHRIQTGLYYVGSRWPDADTAYAEDPPEQDGGAPCEFTNTCTYDFADSRGRSGPVTIILPPGYRAPENKNERYPVVYFLHGYGQSPEDLKAFVILVSPFMGQSLSSRATRLQKMILVFVDGRCRGDAKNPECVRGTFYVDSIRKDGPKMDAYFQDLMSHVDSKYRTMPTTEIDVTE